MRTIQGLPVFLFFSMVSLSFALATVCTYLANSYFQIWNLSEILTLGLWFLLFVGSAISLYRLYFSLCPLPEGEIQQGSPGETRAMVYQLFIMLLWRPIFQTRLLPVPMTRLVYIALGCKVGEGTYFPGVIGDPLHFTAGKNTILGDDSLVIAHAIEGARLAFYPVKLGDNVTIGAKSILMAGVQIEDGAIVAACSVVPKHTQIRSGEVWAGVPARCISKQTVDPNQNDLAS